MFILKNNKSKLVNFLAIIFGLVIVLFLAKQLITILGCGHEVSQIVYKFIPPQLPPGPELNEAFTIQFCMFDENNRCLEGTSLLKKDIRSIKIVKTKKFYGNEKNYSLNICFRDIDKLKKITSQGSAEKKMGVYFNDLCIAKPSFYGHLDSYIFTLDLWDDEDEIVHVIGKNLLEEYKKVW